MSIRIIYSYIRISEHKQEANEVEYYVINELIGMYFRWDKSEVGWWSVNVNAKPKGLSTDFFFLHKT